MRRTTMIPVASVALALLSTTFAPAANAAVEEELATGLVFPLSVAVAPDGTAYVSQNFGAMLTKVTPGEEPEVIYADEGGREVGAVSFVGDVITFATTGSDPVSADLYTYTATDEGYEQAHVADLLAFENATNPDQNRRYGIVGLKKACKKQFTKGLKSFLPYKGIKESHPYASTTVGETTYVADAAANAIFAVDAEGVSTVGVLPPTKVTVTKKIRKAFGIPKCAKGKTYKVEGVPTDVEVAIDGNLYVTSLPGGPEDPAMGANGGLYQVNPTTGAVVKVYGGLVSPTGLALDGGATAYISMLFAGVIMAVSPDGSAEVFAEVPNGPGDVEVIDGYVYATDSGLLAEGPPAGRLLRWSTAP